MTREEAEEYANEMTYRDAVYNALQGKCIPYRKATFIKLYELLDMVEPREREDAISRADTIEWLKRVTVTDGITFETGFKQILTDIQNMPSVTPKPKMGRWIPVSERLPEKYEEVIVTDVEVSDTYQSQYIGNGYWECDNGAFTNRIIAWMPLPEPYKAESED